MKHQMLYIVWTPSLDVGVAILDEQHHGMVSTINSLFYFIQQGWGLNALSPTLKLMRQYAEFHAKTEEGVLVQAGCKYVDEHRAHHRHFMEQTPKTLQTALDEQDPDILLRYLRGWWQAHLTQDHPRYAPSLSAAGFVQRG